jgi:hypothetical protein
MIGRISLAAGLLVLFAPVLGAQPTTAWRPTLRTPRLILDSTSLSLSRISPIANGYGAPAQARLRFEPFTAEHRDESVSAPRLSPKMTELPHCPMPVARLDSTHDPMPVEKPDSTRHYFILVAPPQCTTEPPR